MTEKLKIYQAIIKAGEPHRLPGPWERFRSHDALIRLATEPKSLGMQLVKTFDRRSLIAAGILEESSGDEVRLNPRLAEFKDCLLVSTRPTQSLTVIAGSGPIDRGSSVIKLLKSSDFSTLAQNTSGAIFVAFSAADLAVLWSVGLPAMPGETLAHLGGDDLQEFCRLLRLVRPAAEMSGSAAKMSRTSPARSPIRLILVDWSPAALSLAENPNVRKTETHLSNLGRCLGMDVGGGGVWAPTSKEIDDLKFIITFGELKDVAQALLKSSKTQLAPFVNSTADVAPPTDSLVDALDAWRAACEHDDTQKQGQAWSALRRAHASELINPLIRDRTSHSDSVDKTDIVNLSQLSDWFFKTAAASSARLDKAVRDQGLKGLSQFPGDEFRSLENVAKAIIAQTKEIRSCHKKTARKSGRPLQVPRERPSSKNSASM